MSTFYYPLFADCVLLYNVLALLGSFVSGLSTSSATTTMFPGTGVDTAHFSLTQTIERDDPLARFPNICLSATPDPGQHSAWMVRFGTHSTVL